MRDTEKSKKSYNCIHKKMPPTQPTQIIMLKING